MNCFFVISQEEEVLAAVPKRFPEHHYEVRHGVWALAAADKTPGDICEALGIHGDNKHVGVVVMVSGYNGYFTKNLWEKLQLWEAL